MLLRVVVVAAVLVLSGCSVFKVLEPEQSAFVVEPAPIKFVLFGDPSVSRVRALEGTTDYSGQLSYTSSKTAEANLTLPVGKHTLELTGDVPCWYCINNTFQGRDQRTVCVVANNQVPVTGGPSLTTRSKASGNQSWSAQSRQGIVVAADSGMPETRWNFVRLGGITSTTGYIESTRFPGLCLRSMKDKQNEPIGFGCCNADDPLLQWQALRAPGWSAGDFRVQNQGRGVSDACLTEGPAPGKVLIQRACNDTPDQVWTFRDNQTGQTGVSPF